jgi:hypothetical protein
MFDAGNAFVDCGAMEAAAIGEEDAEATISLDDEAIIPPGFGSRTRKNEHAALRKADAVTVRHEVRHATQAAEFAGSQVADTAHDRPAAGEERGYWGQKSASIVCSTVQGQAAENVLPGTPVSALASMTAFV